MSSKRKIVLAIGLILIAIQFIRIDTSNPKLEPEKDFIVVSQADAKIGTLLQSACYDCHSNTTKYPWYSQIAPVSWWLKDHVNEGREELNFSNWAAYSPKKADHKLEECIELIKAKEMPLASYTWMHGEAGLSEEQRVELVDFLQKQREQINTTKN